MTLKTKLLPHQQTAVDKLYGLRVGALYMEMGTGKTRTALEIIARRLAAGKLDRVLWLCPCSVKKSLCTDVLKHADGIDAKLFQVHGIESLSASDRLYSQLLSYVTSGTTMLIVDESNLVKNPKAIRSQRITGIAEKCRYRMILNGTPISRNESDLFQQWYILDWRILGYRSFYSFAANHIEYDPVIPKRVRRVLNTDYLVEKIAPYSYQCSRDECFKLPPKHYTYRSSDMTPEQREHYDKVCDIMIERLDDQQPSTVYRMFSAAQAVISGLRVDVSGDHMHSERMFDDPHDNPRMQTLLDVLEDFGDEKVLIFAKYSHEIEGILKLLPGAVPFYGELSKTERQRNLERFAADAQYMVANKVCAGYGLNLQFCHNVVYYSNDWDWATRAQSEDRVCRLGQTSDITIVDIETVGTLDQRILRCLQRKERLSDEVKRELNSANDVDEARGSFRKWLKGEMIDGEAVHQ